MAGLVVVEGPNRGAIHALRPDLTRLGRDAGCEVVVLDDRASRVHAEVVVRGDEHVLRDLGSTNGTRLNGLGLEGEAPLSPGDEVRVGDVVYLFVDEAEPDAGAAFGRSTLSIPLRDAGAAPGARAPRASVPERAPALLGQSPALLEVQRRIARAARAEAPVLITGESGTGKELVARALHRASARRRGPFVALNGAVLRGDLLESELFGHEKGAFTGAVARRKGAFELAGGGTLFLDEVGELPLETQAALLRVVEGQPYTRVGGGEPLRAEARLVAATNRDLPARVKEGAFRQDLLYRLEVATIALPPLRERPGDVRLLCEHFLREHGRRAAHAPRRFAPEALEALEAWPWPGNVRELKNTIERLVIFCEGEEVALDDLPPSMRGARREAPAPAAEPGAFPTLREVERRHVERALAETGWNKTRAAALLGIDRVTLYARIERYGLAPPEDA